MRQCRLEIREDFSLARAWRTVAVVLVCGSLISIICNGMRATSGLYLQPMTMAQGGGRETFSLAIALQNLFWGLASPFFGAVADRYGAGRTLAVGALLMVAGYYGMAHAQTALELFTTAGALIGGGVAASGPPLVVTGVAGAGAARGPRP